MCNAVTAPGLPGALVNGRDGRASSRVTAGGLGCGTDRPRGSRRLRGERETELREAGIVNADVTLAYVDDFVAEDEPLRTARRNAAEVGGAAPVGPVTRAVLRFVASAIGARSVVEIGTGCGPSGLLLPPGMRPGAALTRGPVQPGHQPLAPAAVVAP